MLRKEILEQVIVTQHDWILKTDKGIKREVNVQNKLLPKFAFVISGIRRCGKSTLLYQILNSQKKFYYLNLEDPKLEGFDLQDFSKTEDIFSELYGTKGIYFFDEIQNVDKWETYIRYLVDKGNKVVLTGSNASLLSKELGSKLTGRHLGLELFPFSYSEFLTFFSLKASEPSFNKYLFKGGFPEFLKRDDETLLHELLNDILMRDIVVKYGIRNTQLLKKLALYLLSHVGRPFSFNKLKKMFEIKSVQTVIDYIAYFEDAYLLFTLPRFSYSYKKQQINPKKIYSIDTGFSHANSVSFSKDKGRILENCVFLALKRIYKEIFYFQGDKECDFIVKDKDDIVIALQVCYKVTDENENREVQGLLEAMKECDIKKGLILTYNQKDEIEVQEKKIELKPVWEWLLDTKQRSCKLI
ncbi:AAA family ATPase [archaeon]|nr:AAA family ATPase [archaeon]